MNLVERYYINLKASVYRSGMFPEYAPVQEGETEVSKEEFEAALAALDEPNEGKDEA